MKIVFPILRLNWYRLMSPVIDEAMRRGHEVECWHNCDGKNWSSNTPSKDRVPHFLNGKPKILEYANAEEIQKLFFDGTVDAAISLCLPFIAGLPNLDKVESRPRWVVLPTPDTTHDLYSAEGIKCCDLFVHRTAHTRDCVIADHTIDAKPFLEEAERRKRDIGDLYIKRFSERLKKNWNDECIDAYRKRCVVSGYPLFDTIKLANRNELREHWGLPVDVPVVGMLAAPYAGRGFNAEWERIFASPDPVRFKYRNWQRLGCRGLLDPVVHESGVVKGVRQFCKRNGALLITKRRHYQDAIKPTLYEQFSDTTIGEDSFYPHSAIQMGLAADLVLGFYTTGTSETVAAGCHMLDIIAPGAPRDLHDKYAHIFDGMFSFPGAATSMTAKDIMHELPHRSLADFVLNSEARAQYNAKFNGRVDGLHSQRMLTAVEYLVQHENVENIPVEEDGTVCL